MAAFACCARLMISGLIRRGGPVGPSALKDRPLPVKEFMAPDDSK